MPQAEFGSRAKAIEIWSKRLGLLRELIPAASRVGFLASRDVAEAPAMREAAQEAGISLVAPPLEGALQEAEYRRVFKLMTQERAAPPRVGLLSSWLIQARLSTRVNVEFVRRWSCRGGGGT